jgi:hypothetical protein
MMRRTLDHVSSQVNLKPVQAMQSAPGYGVEARRTVQRVDTGAAGDARVGSERKLRQFARCARRLLRSTIASLPRSGSARPPRHEVLLGAGADAGPGDDHR